MTQDYIDCFDWLSQRFERIDGVSFYKKIFPNNQKRGELNSNNDWKSNAVYLYEPKEKIGKRKLNRRIMLDDTWSEDYDKYIKGNPMTLCSGLSYRGRTNKLAHARLMHAMIFDIDGVGETEINWLFYRAELEEESQARLPRPTYTVLSGAGMHLYYLFKEPIELFPNIKLQLKQLKYALTSQLWCYNGTSKYETTQYQSIAQGFRMVGSINNKYGNEVVAFKTGDEVDLNYLNSFVDEKDKVDLQKRFTTKYKLEDAQVKFPDWYERVIVRREKNKGKWTVNQSVYQWFLKNAMEIKKGHRYHGLLCCVIYADKCGVPFDQLKKDLIPVYEELKKKEHINELTESDMNDALEIYGTGCHTTPIDYIERITGLRIERNRRNYRSQEQHLIMARFVRDEVNGKRDTWRKGNGRPSKELIVKKWRFNNPNGRKIDCERETGLSRPTVLKWWG